MNEEAYRVDTIGKGEWPLFLRTVAIPLSDSVFVERQINTLARGSSLLSFRLVKSLIDILRNPYTARDVAVDGFTADYNYKCSAWKYKITEEEDY
jgi:hypothetical protein